MKVVVNEFAKSAYAGRRGTVVWPRIGIGSAKFVRLVFDSGHCAGRQMWFARRELNIPPTPTKETGQ